MHQQIGGNVDQIGAVTSLVSVVVSGWVAVLSIRQAAAESRRRRVQEYSLALLPRRLDVVQSAWALIFDLEAGSAIGSERSRRFVETSVWLPEPLRSDLVSVLSDPSSLTTERSKAIRAQLGDVSGVHLLERSSTSLSKDVR